MIEIATDGACRNNQNKDNIGSWGIVVANNGNVIHQDSGIKINTTNNQMELTAFIKALEYIIDNEIKKADIIVDSSYVYNAYTLNWIFNWEKQNFINKKQLRPNTDLWKKSLVKWRTAQDLNKKINLIKIKGHTNHELNILADALCNQIMNDYQINENIM